MRGEFWARAAGAILAVFCAISAPAYAQELLSPLFADHAVLQRDKPIRIWGQASPRERVTVTFNNRRVAARADAAGAWSASFPAMQAGGPYALQVEAASGARASAEDILIGDVWLCAGQSNMELPVSRTLNADREIGSSADAGMRLLGVSHTSAAAPARDFESVTAWAPARPDSVGGFSGTCYYFARELRRHSDVPLGLINASWGGSPIEGWISARGLRATGNYGPQLALLADYVRDPAGGVTRFGAAWQDWWRSRAGDAPWEPNDSGAQSWAAAPEALGDWKRWGDPALAAHNGMVWYRRTVQLTAAQAAQGATLALGGIDEIDQTWVNGRAIGASFGWGSPRNYDVAPGVLRAGENVIVLNVLSTWDAGGLIGPPSAMHLRFADGSSAPLAGGWTYRMAPMEMGMPPRAPWHAIGGVSTINNGMIAPLRGFGLRGAVWYQGESNAGDAGAYEGLLEALIADWRAQFGADLPFLVAQLPDFGARQSQPMESGWASLREAQRRVAARDPRTAMAVTIDLGDPRELHPPNKQDVGLRLARAARAMVYGAAHSESGPTPVSARRDGAGVVVNFANVEGALLTYSSARAIGFELCGAAGNTCRFVSGVVQGDRVVLEAEGAQAARVRFCWGDSPICNLYDGAGLPAGPFEIAVE